MATINCTTGQQVHEILGGYKGVISNRISLATWAPSATDTLQCVKVEDGMTVTNVRVVISTASGGTLTATVGDGAGANSWDASTNLNAAAATTTAGIAGTDAYADAGKTYAADDTIDLVLSNNAPGTTGVFYVVVEYVRAY